MGFDFVLMTAERFLESVSVYKRSFARLAVPCGIGSPRMPEARFKMLNKAARSFDELRGDSNGAAESCKTRVPKPHQFQLL
jgi:hypothetical protein